MAYDIVLGTVSEFIEIAQAITAIFIVYYLFKFLFYSDKDADKEWNERGAASRKAVGDLITKHKDEKKKKDLLDGRKKYLDKSMGYLHRALDAAQELQERLHTQTKSEVDKTKSGVGKLKSNLSTARRNTRGAHRHHKDHLTEDLRELHAAIDAVLEKCKDLLDRNIPENEEDKHFEAKGKLFRSGAGQIANYIAALYSSVHKFVDKHEEEKLKISANIKNLEEEVKRHKAHMDKLKGDHNQKKAHDGAQEEARQRSLAEQQARARAEQQAGGPSGSKEQPQPTTRTEKRFVPVGKFKRRE